MLGVDAFLASAIISSAVYFGAFAAVIQPFSPIAAVVIAAVLALLMAVLTRAAYYLRRTDDGIAEPRFDADGTPVDTAYTCDVCHQTFERPDGLAYAVPDTIVSPCVTTDHTGALPAT